MRSLRFLSSFLLAVLVDGTSRSRTEWMQGNWGIGLRIPARPSYWENFNVPEFVEQLKNMTGKPSWVLINLSGPSNWGDSYLSYNPLLVDELGNVDATPTAGERDLFQELSDAIHAEGIKVIAYMAGQGPALLKLTTKYYDNIASGDSHEEAVKGTLDRAYDWDSVTLTSEARDNWLSWVSETYDCPVLQITWDGNRVNSDESFACEKQAYAEHIVTYYSNKFTTAIDGYWIDQGTVTNREMVTAACRSGNPDAVVAINHGAKMPLQVNNPGLEDYTFGHPTPLRRGKSAPSSNSNEEMVESVEDSVEGYLQDGNWEVLGHVFMPASRTAWNSGAVDPGWDTGGQTGDLFRAKDWMSRVLDSGGAWTWNVPRSSNSISLLNEDHVEFMNQVTEQFVSSTAPSVASSQSPSIVPSASPSQASSSEPSTSPSVSPSSQQPSTSPSIFPSGTPSSAPSVPPSQVPSNSPSFTPPSETPSTSPSTSPSSNMPSNEPSLTLSDTPSTMPSQIPSSAPSSNPSVAPLPSSAPSLLVSENEWFLDCSGYECNENDNEEPHWKVCVVDQETKRTEEVCIESSSILFQNVRDDDHYCGPCTSTCHLPIVDTDVCDDSHYCKFDLNDGSGRSKPCRWLAGLTDATLRDMYCNNEDEAKRLCPESCGSCADSCFDDDSQKVIVDGRRRRCNWLRKRPQYRTQVCVEGEDAWTGCREYCGNCEETLVAIDVP